MVDIIVFFIAAAIVLGGGLGVVLQSNPVHAALSLIASFFGVAVLFIIQEAHFLALVQVVVYAGAIVVLFLFVIMLLGVDQSEDLRTEPIVGQRSMGVFLGLTLFALIMGGLFLSGPSGDDPSQSGLIALSGQESAMVPLLPTGSDVADLEEAGILADIDGVDEATLNAAVDQLQNQAEPNVTQLGRDLFTRNILAFEATSILLTIATIGAVVLVRNRGGEDLVIDEPGLAVE